MSQLIQFVTLQKRIRVQLELNWISPGEKKRFYSEVLFFLTDESHKKCSPQFLRIPD